MDNTQLPTGAGGDSIRTLDKTGTGTPKTEVVALDLGGADGRSEFVASLPLPIALDGPTDDDGVPVWSLSPTSMDALEMLFRQTIAASGYPRTLAEISAQVPVIAQKYYPGDPRRYGAVGDGSTDDSVAFSRAALVCGTHPMTIYYTTNGYVVNIPFALPNNGQIQGVGRPTLLTNTLGAGICYGNALTGEPSVQGVIFKGNSVWAGTAAIAATTLTISTTTAGAMKIGMVLTGIAMVANTTVTAGGGLTWTVSVSQTISLETMSGYVAATTGYGGFSPLSTGLLTIDNSSNVRIIDCDFSLFPCGVGTNGCSQVYIDRNQVYDFTYTGIQLAQSQAYVLLNNDIHDCHHYGGATFSPSYGVQVSGNIEGGFASNKNFIISNRIINIPAWCGIGSHDTDVLTVSDNDIRNIRQGINVGHLATTNICKHIKIDDNYVEGPTTDPWNGAAIEIAGIAMEGLGQAWTGTASITGTALTITVNSTGAMVIGATITGVGVAVGTKIVSGSGNNWVVSVGLTVGSIAMIAYACVEGASITNNTLSGWFNTTGMVGAGFGAGCIAAVHTNDCTIADNTIMESGNATTTGAFTVPAQTTGIYCFGLCNRLSITGNSISGGSFVRGAVRLSSVTSDNVKIAANNGMQSVVANNHVVLTGSTITSLNVGNNPSNSTAAYTDSGCTITYYSAGGATGSFTGTLTGCTTAPTGSIAWSVANGIATLNIPIITATSNTTACTVTGLPAQLQPLTFISSPLCSAEDNTVIGGAASYNAVISPASGTIVLTKNSVAAGFTNVGTKGIVACTITYMLN